MKKIIFPLIAVAAAFIAGVALYSCGTDDSNSGDQTDEETPLEEAVSESQPETVKVYIDASGSMRDYFGKIDIQNISDALTSLQQVAKDMNTEYYVWGVPPTVIKPNDLVEKLIGKDLKGKSTMFDKILGPMAEASGSDSLTVLITDGIISSAWADTHKSEKFTDYSKGILTNNIQKVLSENKGKAISIYRIIGNFKGNYCDKANKGVPYEGERPFFVIALGNPDVVRYFDNQVRKNNVHEVYTKAEAIHIGTAPEMTIRIEPTDADNMAEAESFSRQDGTTNYNYTGIMPFRVSAELPKWVIENYGVQTIKAMSEITINDKKTNIKPTIDGNILYFDIPQSITEKNSDNGTQYTITYRMSDPSAKAWDKYSTDDDTQPDSVTTYLLKDFIGAMRKGLIGTNDNLLESSMTIIPSEPAQ